MGAISLAGPSLLDMIQESYPGYHPLLAIARLAHTPTVMADPKLELECHKVIAAHTVPRLTAIEAKVEVTETRRVIVSLFEADAPIDVTPLPGAQRALNDALTASDLELSLLAEVEAANAS